MNTSASSAHTPIGSRLSAVTSIPVSLPPTRGLQARGSSRRGRRDRWTEPRRPDAAASFLDQQDVAVGCHDHHVGGVSNDSGSISLVFVSRLSEPVGGGIGDYQELVAGEVHNNHSVGALGSLDVTYSSAGREPQGRPAGSRSRMVRCTGVSPVPRSWACNKGRGAGLRRRLPVRAHTVGDIPGHQRVRELQ